MTRHDPATSPSRPRATGGESSLSACSFLVGARFEASYPFIRDTYEGPVSDCDGVSYIKMPTWKPGVRFIPVYPDDGEAVADGIGKIILRVVSIHKPGRYPTRVFFLRLWQTPDGNVFGKAKLRIATLEKFRRLTRGYAHSYRLLECVA